MNKNMIPAISIEKMAAYLDHNLSTEEMQDIDSLMNDSDHNPLLEELKSIGDEILLSDQETTMPDIEILDNWRIPELLDYNSEDIDTFQDDLFFEETPDDSTNNYDADSNIEHIHNDDF